MFMYCNQAANWLSTESVIVWNIQTLFILQLVTTFFLPFIAYGEDLTDHVLVFLEENINCTLKSVILFDLSVAAFASRNANIFTIFKNIYCCSIHALHGRWLAKMKLMKGLLEAFSISLLPYVPCCFCHLREDDLTLLSVREGPIQKVMLSKGNTALQWCWCICWSSVPLILPNLIQKIHTS